MPTPLLRFSKRLGQWGLTLAVLIGLLPSLPVVAADGDLEWTEMPGRARDLATGADGRLYAVSVDGNAWQWRTFTDTWAPLPGRLVRIAGGEAGRPWGIAPDGTILRYKGSWWQPVGRGGEDIATGPGGVTYAVFAEGRIARWIPLQGAWAAVDGTASRIAVAPDGTLWAVGRDGRIGYRDGEGWHGVKGRARDIAVGPDGTVFMVSDGGALFRRAPDARAWSEVKGGKDVATVAVGPGGMPWIADEEGHIQSSSAPSHEQEVRVEPVPEKASRIGDWIFTDTGEKALHVAIGADGSVFALTETFEMRRWSNEAETFRAFSGQFVRLTVEPSGNPWAVTAQGYVFRHTGTDWRQVGGTASDLSAARDGTVLATDAEGNLYRATGNKSALMRISGQGLKVAATPDGRPWTIDEAGNLLNCEGTPCKLVRSRAADLAIGPDGVTFLVTEAGELLWLDDGRWRAVDLGGHKAAKVAVGPGGMPWVVTRGNRVLASAFFPRDESHDVRIARRTSEQPNRTLPNVSTVAGTHPTGSTISRPKTSGFVFTKNMAFDEMKYPSSQAFTAFQGLEVGHDGTVFLYGTAGGERVLRYYLPDRQVMKTHEITPPSGGIRNMAVDEEGVVWFVVFGGDQVYKQRGPGVSGYRTYDLPNLAGGETARNVQIGADGTVYVMTSQGNVFRKKPNATGFKKWPLTDTVYDMAVGYGDDLWMLSLSDFERVKRFDGTKFVTVRNYYAHQIVVGPEGSIYIDEKTSNRIHKWNETNRTFDKLNTTLDPSGMAIAPDGRLWVKEVTTDKIYRARGR